MSNSSSRVNFMESYIHIDYSDKESYVRKSNNSYHIIDEQISSLSDKNNQNNNYNNNNNNNKMNNNKCRDYDKTSILHSDLIDNINRNLLESDENIFISSTNNCNNNIDNINNNRSSPDKTEKSNLTNSYKDNKYKTNNSNSNNTNSNNIFNNTYNGSSNNAINTALRESCNRIEIINNIINGKINISQNMTENNNQFNNSSSYSRSCDDTGGYSKSSSAIVVNSSSSSNSSSNSNNFDENSNNEDNRHNNSSDSCSFGGNSSKFNSFNTTTKNIKASSSLSRTIRPTIFCYPCLIDLKRKIDKEIQNEQLRNTLYSDSLNSVIVARNNDYDDDSDFDYNAEYYRMKLNEINIDDAHDSDDNNDNDDDDDWNEHVDYSMNDKNDDENFIIHGIKKLKSLEHEYQLMKIEENQIRKVIYDNNIINNEQQYSLSDLMKNDTINNDILINERLQISIDNMINVLNISTYEIENLNKFIELMK